MMIKIIKTNRVYVPKKIHVLLDKIYSKLYRVLPKKV